MKHVLLTILLALCSLAASAQTPKFFGVPVDGTPEKFVNALRDKGLELEMMTENHESRIYAVTNHITSTKLMLKYSANLTYSVMLVVDPERNESYPSLLVSMLKQMKEDNGDGDYESDAENGVSAIYKMLQNGKAVVLITEPGVTTKGYRISYIVENIENSRKALEQEK